MVLSQAESVIIVRFPFSDLSVAKVRPAVVLADAGRGDWILCQITSAPYGDPRAVYLLSPPRTSGPEGSASRATSGPGSVSRRIAR